MRDTPIDISRYLPEDAAAATARTVTPMMASMQGSRILKIAAQVRAMVAEGREICNLTIGDFRPQFFPIPALLNEKIREAYGEGHTSYPPADGVPELKDAIASLYRDKLGLDYGAESVCVGSGARPPLYASWRLLTGPGVRTLSQAPAWNSSYYAHINGTDHHFIPTSAETNFFPTAEQVKQVLPGARLLLLNSPLNPTGTAIDRDVMAGIAQAIVEENWRRGSSPPVMLLFDQVYWMLTADGTTHHTPVQLVPEVAPYVIHIDAISKCFAATGVRVGWGVMPSFLQGRMRALIGHMGAWAPRPEQLATAWLLNHPAELERYMVDMRARIADRLSALHDGIIAMKSAGLPVDAIAPQGAIYLSLKVDLIGRGFDTNEQIRNYLLEEAGVAVVPFQAFDMPEESGWFRMSIGAVDVPELHRALDRLERAIRARL